MTHQEVSKARAERLKVPAGSLPVGTAAEGLPWTRQDARAPWTRITQGKGGGLRRRGADTDVAASELAPLRRRPLLASVTGSRASRPGGVEGQSPRLACFLLLSLLASAPAWAISDPAEALRDPGQEARAERLGRQLRCLVCQNESIEDSGADLARDLRQIVRARVTAGDDDTAVVQYLVDRYGDFVRLRPPFNAGTAVLWASPVLALGLACLLIVARRRVRAAPVALSAEEQARLRDLLKP